MHLFTPSQFFRAIGDDTRLHAMLLVHQEGELCVCELMAALNINQSKVSRHLAQLKALGLLSDVRRGQWVYYSLPKTLPPWVYDTLQSACTAETSVLSRFLSNLKAMPNRPSCC